MGDENLKQPAPQLKGRPDQLHASALSQSEQLDSPLTTNRAAQISQLDPKDGFIAIRQRARHLELCTLKISTRLQRVFDFCQAKTLGDMHGLSIREISEMRNCGRATITDLKRLLAQTNSGYSLAPSESDSDIIGTENWPTQVVAVKPKRSPKVDGRYPGRSFRPSPEIEAMLAQAQKLKLNISTLINTALQVSGATVVEAMLQEQAKAVQEAKALVVKREEQLQHWRQEFPPKQTSSSAGDEG